MEDTIAREFVDRADKNGAHFRIDYVRGGDFAQAYWIGDVLEHKHGDCSRALVWREEDTSKEEPRDD